MTNEQMPMTPGKWRLGNQVDTVVTDFVEGIDKHHLEYYGGHVIAESVLNEADRHLISAAPNLLESLIEVLRFHEDETHDVDVWNMARQAIKKARGEVLNDQQ